jgi:hypothetical protein
LETALDRNGSASELLCIATALDRGKTSTALDMNMDAIKSLYGSGWEQNYKWSTTI